MRIAPAQHRAYTYKVTTQPAELPVTLALFKQHINVTHSLRDDLLNLYLGAVTKFAENYTGRCLINRTITTYRDFFPAPSQNEGYYNFGEVPAGATTLIPSSSGNAGFELRRSPLVSVESVNYVDTNNQPQLVDPSVYYVSIENDYSELLAANDQEWPSDSNNRLQNISIEFVCGYGATEADISEDWKIAIMNHAAALWANRGDCTSVGCGKALPGNAKTFYDIKRIRNL